MTDNEGARQTITKWRASADELEGEARTLRAAADRYQHDLDHRPKPWDAAVQHEVWALTNPFGWERPHVRSVGGWRSFGRKGRIFQSADFVSGYRIWTPPRPFPGSTPEGQKDA